MRKIALFFAAGLLLSLLLASGTISAAPARYALTVGVTGNGAVSQSPDKSRYNRGETVRLTAKPSSGWTFSGWSGDLTGTANPVSLTMNENKRITGAFTRNTPTPTPTPTPPPTSSSPPPTPSKPPTSTAPPTSSAPPSTSAAPPASTKPPTTAPSQTPTAAPAAPAPPPVVWLPPEAGNVNAGGGGGGGSSDRTYLTGFMGDPGVFSADATAKAWDGLAAILFPKGTRFKTVEGWAGSYVTMEPVKEIPPPEPIGGNIIGLAYELGPEGASFEPSITLKIIYDKAKIHQDINETGLAIGCWDGFQWSSLESAVDSAAGAVTAKISHFSQFAVVYRPAPELAPSPSPVSLPSVSPATSAVVSPTPSRAASTPVRSPLLTLSASAAGTPQPSPAASTAAARSTEAGEPSPVIWPVIGVVLVLGIIIGVILFRRKG